MIPFNVPPCGKNAIKYVTDAITSKKIAGDGPYANKCEAFLEKKLNSNKIFLTPSGTSSLEFACMLADIGPKDEVILPSFTFPTSATAIIQFSGTPVFVDIRKDTMCIDETKIEAAITEHTKAIMVVHYAGVGCEMDEIMAIAKKHNLLVIEDAAQVMNAKYKGQYLGTIGDIGCFSFHATKNYAMGEGGAISINNKSMLEKAYHMRDSGTDAYDFERGMVAAYTWVDRGSSYLCSDMQAAYLYAQLEEMDEINEDRKRSFYLYHQELKELADKGLLTLPFLPEYDDINGHMYYIRTSSNEEREALRLFLKERGIQAVFHYQSLHTSKAGKKYCRFVGEDINTTAENMKLLRLPMYYGLKEEDVITVCNAIKEFYKEK